MKAWRIPLGRPLEPFGDPPADVMVLGDTLAGVQEQVLAELGLELVDAPPDEPYLALGDHTWLTAPLLARFLEACPVTGGQLAVGGPFADFTHAVQELPGDDVLRYPVAVVPGGEPTSERLASLPAVQVDPDVRPQQLDLDHPVFAEAGQGPIPVTDAMVHTVDHWSHLLRVNLLALVAVAEGERRRFEGATWWRKLWSALMLLLRARSVDPWRIASAVGHQGARCRVHPTATVEACILGDDVEVGPHAVVRASWLGDGVKVGEHARVNLTVAGERAHLARGVMANLCVLMPGAFLSPGWGFQVCLLGRDSFVAAGVTCYDLSFGGEVRVSHRGERVGSGTRFLGSAIGHRARLGPHVVVGYGEEVPNDALLVADPDRVARRIPADLPPDEAHYIRGGQILPVRRRS